MKLRCWSRVITVLLLGLLPQWMHAEAGARTVLQQLQDALQSSSRNIEQTLVGVVAIGDAGPIVVGTGFFVNADGLFVTAAHTFSTNHGLAFRAYVNGVDGHKHLRPVRVLQVDKAHDLALCRIEDAADPKDSAKFEIHVLPLAESSNMPVGTLVASSGLPLTLPTPMFHFGAVSGDSPADQPLELGIMVNEGESGAPAVRLDSGEIVGMVLQVRTASVYSDQSHSGAEQNAGLSQAARVEWIRALIAQVANGTRAPVH